MFCTACAHHNPATLLRCPACGASLRPNGALSRPISSRRGKRQQRFRVILTVTPLIILTLAGIITFRTYRAEQATLAAAYARAETAIAVGDYSAAIAAYAEAGGYRDAETRRNETLAAVEPIRAAYIAGADALADGDFDLAIASLDYVVRALPNYEDAEVLLAEASAMRTKRLTSDLHNAEANRDWLRAEQIIQQLLADDPGNQALLEQFSTLARTHAPMVFARDGGIYLISPDLFDEQLVTDDVNAAWPAWSPDRTKIAFVGSAGEHDNAHGLYIVNPDGAGLKLLAQNVRMEGWPAWSPDGTRIAFSSVIPFEFEGEHGIASLHVVDIATGVETDYTSDVFHFTGSPSWSPDSSRIAFVAKQIEQNGPALGRSIDGSVQLLDPATGSITQLAKGHFATAVYVAWSPRDELLLVLSSNVGTGWYETPLTTIDLIDPRTGEIEEIAKKSLAASYPVWSPDGARFAFAEGNDLIQVRSVVGGIRWINVTRDIAPFLSWSLDGSAIFAPSNNAGRSSIIVPLDGSETADMPIVFSQSGPPRWSPVSFVIQPDS